ncbi:MAG: efflux RND transporter periplasmic adaptor subunit [Thermodesulfovibrionales bacterium]|jgi:HlyD family secretion protein
MKKNRWIIVIVIAAVVMGVIVYGFMPRPAAVDLVKVSRGPMQVTVEEEGETRVKDRFVLSAPVAGFMRRILLQVGDPVVKGQAVVELEPPRSAVPDPRSRAAAEAAVSSAEAALRAAQENARARAADAEYAATKKERTEKLFAEGYASKNSMDLAVSDAKRAGASLLSAEATVKSARFELEKARTALLYSAEPGRGSRVSVSSPVSGVVLKRHRESEGMVNSGEPLIDIGDPARLEVQVEVLSADAVKIRPGTPVLFERWGGDSALSGKVRVVEPAGFTKVSSLGVEEQRTLVIADITSLPQEWRSLGDNYRVEARFIIWEAGNVLQVPAGALFRTGEGGWAVFIVRGNRAELRKVRPGQRNGLTAEVVSGLAKGEIVISHPDESIRDGSKVKPR